MSFRLSVVVAVVLLLGACSQPGPAGNVEEHRDQHRPREAQSDFIDIGKQAGIEWLSFVQQDQDKYPEYFDGLDRDQKRRLRLANTGDGEMILIEFNLPEGSKLWPVDWYGTELMAIDLPNAKGFSVGLCKSNELNAMKVASERAASIGGTYSSYEAGLYTVQAKPGLVAAYSMAEITGRTGKWSALVEWRGEPAALDHVKEVTGRVAESISIKREIALEGGPKHKVSSSLELLLGGTLHYPKGSLVLPIGDELVRKTGNDSTVQLDAHGAEPWLLLRRLKESDLPGDLRARVQADTTFNRRLKESGAQFSAGYDPGWNFPAVLWDYSHAGGEQIVLGVLVVGIELLSLEVVSTGLRDGEARRRAKAAALELLKGANTAPVGDRKPLEPLVGWNLGNMGRDD